MSEGTEKYRVILKNKCLILISLLYLKIQDLLSKHFPFFGHLRCQFPDIHSYRVYGYEKIVNFSYRDHYQGYNHY
jgi:hypothetical protein